MVMGFAQGSTHPTCAQIRLTGKSLGVLPVWLSSPICKNISVFASAKSAAYPSRPVPTEGRFAIVTNAGRDAVDATASGAQWQSQGEMNLVSGQLACKMIGA